MYKKITREIRQRLEKIVGERNLTFDPEKMEDYSHDEFSLSDIVRMPELVVKPTKTEEVAGILRLASEEMIPVTPRGGATGLCGGCVPSHGGIVLSLENMNRIVEIDLDNQMAVVEAGVTLSDFYTAVEEGGLFFPPHPGEESAMIGGVIATNAGGARAVKYGVVRNYVRGLEVVLASGVVIHLGGKLMKSSTGYNLLNLFIGSEGTLGIITKAIIQLMPSPQMTRSLIVPYDDLEKAIETVPFMVRKKVLPLAVEFVPKELIRITEEFLKKRWPCSQGSTYLLLILDASSEDEMDRLSEEVAEICMEKGALDVYVADSPKKQEEVLDIRSKIYEAIKAHTLEVLDIVIPRAEIARHVKRVQEVSQEYQIWLPTFGHAADGNVHTHIMAARFEEGKIIPLPEEDWKVKHDKVREELYRDCKSRGGMISGEHGIGVVKKPYLSYVVDEGSIGLMKGIKRIFDPQNILNPGKIFD
ncbi:MAG: FAD-binding oxidoreductase [Candidatus Aminicenantes bacterium]|nr:FAD-binding oxidoreductase [Candidatus Aminicenantes bacterium]MDH5705773.1 FAD-binding oxidoreductase [Candidatus Aminicenantes bacterium]